MSIKGVGDRNSIGSSAPAEQVATQTTQAPSDSFISGKTASVGPLTTRVVPEGVTPPSAGGVSLSSDPLHNLAWRIASVFPPAPRERQDNASAALASVLATFRSVA